ncbi:MAG: DNA-directed RNA polymerase subunit beta' [Holosporales bacterium]|jgi:DNA-directed RNA polymerase subunit beta'|nr:DNA-directed RNA polymerase subunit beta' [Holosporales bacterium]
MVNQLQRAFGQTNSPDDFDAIRISLASPERIRSWSFGEVKKPETINYRTFKPERDGLFCARIFGPTKDYECLCGKYKRMKYRGVVCEKCGVEVTLSKVRRERMGHIELATPVAHIWFTKSMPSRIALLLDISMRDMEHILYFENFVVTEPGLTPFKLYQLLAEEEYYQAQDEYGEDSFSASIGAEALKTMLLALDLEETAENLREELIATNSEMRRRRIVKRLKLVESFIQSHSRPEWMILSCIPVIPPELRPLVPLDGGRFATSDLNDLYRRVINRNNRLRRLIELRAPDIIVRNEKRMLQESVDALFDNGRRGRLIMSTNRRPLKSLSDMLKGKQGRFRQNLLGKRVDYSGRSVIVVGPKLKLHQCGLPKRMALELFKPFIYSRLERYGLASTLKAAKRMVEKERSEVWDILEEVIREHPVLLNRAPTLHRLGIQAFEPILVEGKAIQLHPLVCTAFNADFDGDQMAVHVPLSLEAQLEARVLMMSTNNILSPASGRPIIVPTKDIVLGLYYLTSERKEVQGEGMIFGSIEEIELALHEKVIGLHAPIIARYEQHQPDGKVKRVRVQTTPGRMLLSTILPKGSHIPFSTLNKQLTSKDITNLIGLVYRHYGQKDTVIFADRLVQISLKYVTASGISFGKDDLIIPEEKKTIIAATRTKVGEYERQYLDGLITQGEKYNKVIDTWTHCNELIAEAMMKRISTVKPGDYENAVYTMAHSGARGSVTQMRQIIGMRGLMAKSSGQIIETPIISNFKEGLTVLEYFTSAHGARKGLADTALKTANAGYLTRRLVDVAQDCVISMEDCGTTRSITLKDIMDNGEITVALSDRVMGRTIAEDVVDKATEKVVIPCGTLIDETLLPCIEAAGVTELKVRSVLTCEAQRGACAKCYGRDLARGQLVNVGEAVGIIAAQSIGEPGTQLTLQTFHVGGAAQGSSKQSSAAASLDATVAIRNRNIVVNTSGRKIVMGRHTEIVLKDARGRERANYKLPYGATLYVDDNDGVTKGQSLAEWDPYTFPLIAEDGGIAQFIDLVNGVSLREVVDETTGITTRVVVDWRQQAHSADLKPRIVLCDDKGNPLTLANGQEIRHFVAIDAILNVNNGDYVHVGDVLARVPRESSKTRDITGGLPRISELFEARKPKDGAVMSEFNGHIEFGKDYKGKRRIIVRPDDESLPAVEYLAPKWRYVAVQEGDVVQKGEVIIDGNPIPHDILQVLGVEALADHLVNEIQAVYRLQGVKIDDKHVEIIIRQMLKKVEVADPGETMLLVGETLDRDEFEAINADIQQQGRKLAMCKPVLQGITKASLQTKSFISAAAFQETTRVLTEVAVNGKSDNLIGLKENVMVGRLVPAGTGCTVMRYKNMAAHRDAELLKAEEAAALSQA